MNKVIFLYKKESPLGLKYLGITTRDPFKYKGSGTYWKKHINKYKFTHNDIKTTILFKSHDVDMISLTGIYYSNLWKVVDSEDWANLIPECGSKGYQRTVEHKMILMDMIKKRVWTDSDRNQVSIMHKGKIVSDKTKQLLSIRMRGNKLSDATKLIISNHHKENKVNCKKVDQYDLSNNFIKTWESAKHAALSLNITASKISNCCNNKRKTHFNFIWKFNK